MTTERKVVVLDKITNSWLVIENGRVMRTNVIEKATKFDRYDAEILINSKLIGGKSRYKVRAY